MQIYTTKEADMVDDIAFKAYADETQIALIHSANPGLINQPIRLPAGLKIKLPALPERPTQNPIKDVWG